MQTAVRKPRHEHALSRVADDAGSKYGPERTYVGALLDLLATGDHPEVAKNAVAAVTPEMIRDDDCRDIAAAIARVVDENATPSIVDVAACLRSEPGGCRLSGMLAELMRPWRDTRHVSARQAAEAAEELEQLHRERRAAELVDDAADRIRRGEPASEVLGDIVKHHETTVAAGSSSKTISFKQCCDEWASHERSPVVPTGLRPFDAATQGGLPLAAITGFVAPPGGCKSAMALQLVLGALHADKQLRAVYGLGEMSPGEIAERYACTGAFVYDLPPVTTLQASRRHRNARETLATLYADMGDRLTFVPSPLTVPALAAEVARTGAKLLVVDYLQLVKGEGTNKVEELDGIVDELQRLAVARGVAVVVISSMAKATGQQARAHEWARGSGQIGYALKLLYVGERDEHADQDGTYGFKWVCRKARSIPQTDVELRWDPDLQTFAAAERPDEAFAAFAPGRPR